MSSVTTNAVNPFSFARFIIESVNSLSTGLEFSHVQKWGRGACVKIAHQYSWYQRCPEPLAAATCSIVRVEAVLMMYVTPIFFAAVAVAISPSWWTMPCTPTGAISNGDVYFTPNRVVWMPRKRQRQSERLAHAGFGTRDTHVYVPNSRIAKHTRNNPPPIHLSAVPVLS